MIQDMPVKIKPRISQVELKWHKTCVSRSSQGIHKNKSNDTRHACQDQAKDFTSTTRMIQDMHASSNSTTAPSLQPCSCSSSTKHAPIARGRSILAIACQKKRRRKYSEISTRTASKQALYIYTTICHPCSTHEDTAVSDTYCAGIPAFKHP
jgi:hypothetical protein